MVKAAWGMKRICASCAAHFYDMQKSPIVCPKCGTIHDPEATAKTRRKPATPAVAKPVAVRRPDPVAAEVVDPELEAIEAEDDDEEEAVIEDTSDLGEDEDVSSVIEKENEEKE